MRFATCTLLAAALGFASLASAQNPKVDESPLPVKMVRAWPKLKVRRPVAIANAGDGSGRVFVCTQQGIVHIMPKDGDGTETQVFLDIEEKVTYKDKENEEGLLGLAFHPKFKQNGEFFVFYTTSETPHTSVLSRFKVSKDNPNVADPKSEEELFRIPPKMYWNHNGGGLAFGADGYLYVGIGDGGSANDPHNNGQNLETILGKILRIDVNSKSEGLKYGIPKDNPFVGKDKARGEIYAYGLRNPWGLSFDKPTGLFYVADVGQDLWEEIDLVTKGGNYGWRLREGFHKFKDGSEARPDLIEPIWEYHHNVGKSITGGHVYRGKKTSELAGYYLYADYISGLVWGLKYDEKAKKVVANRPIDAPKSPYNLPIVSFGIAEDGEVYVGDAFHQLWQFVSTDMAPASGDKVSFFDDFERGHSDKWEPTDPTAWKVKRTEGGQVFSQHKKNSNYKPPHRAPFNMALVKEMTVGDVQIDAKVLSTNPDYGHRDVCLFFGYQDPGHLYYVHLGKKADDHANQIFIVNGADRKKISLTSTEGTNWDDNWHNVRVVRKVGDGTIEVYFDDMQKPVMTAKDTTFTWGRVGVGSFDDTSDWDDVKIEGVVAKSPQP